MTRALPAVRCEAVVDLAAVRSNVATLRTRLRSGVALMAVVKADGYGHGVIPVAAAVLDAGADHLGVATLQEALQVREAGISAPLLAWLWVPGADPGPALAADIALGISSVAQLDAVLAAPVDARPRVHVKIDTGLGRNGAAGDDIAVLLCAAAAAERAGRISVVGLMSHLAGADVAGDASVAEQTAAFAAAGAAATAAGLQVRYAHLANTAGTLDHPDLQLDLVRIGIGLFGLDPTPAGGNGLRPAMTLRATVALTKRVPAGHGVSYGHTYRTVRETTLALVPLGYADGIPRAASNRAEVLIGGRRLRIAGRVAMDQFVVDCGNLPVTVGDEVLVFGPGDAGEPTARDWAEACDTIDYEIVTRIGPRTPRRHVDAAAATGAAATGAAATRTAAPGGGARR